jgi:hypothetical protein
LRNPAISRKRAATAETSSRGRGRPRACRAYGVLAVYLFGSRADGRGTLLPSGSAAPIALPMML